MVDIIAFATSHSGEFIALAVAALWGVGSILYTWIGKSIRPMELNFLKNGVGVLLFTLSILFLEGFPNNLSLNPVIYLFISGAIGIGLGDTAYFSALQLIGARQASLIKILAPPMAAWIAYFSLHEELSINSWVGTILIVLSVAWVITEHEKPKDTTSFKHPPKIQLKGILLGVFAAVSEAGGVVLSHAAMTQSSIEPAMASWIRLLAGFIVSAITLIFIKASIFQWLSNPSRYRIIFTSFAAILMGTFTGIWLQQIALQRIQAGVAQTLIATSPVFVLFITAIMGDKFSLRNFLGVIFSVVGISFLFL